MPTARPADAEQYLLEILLAHARLGAGGRISTQEAVATSNMRDIVILTVVIVGLFWTLKKSYIGVLIWAWISYMNPHRLAWGFAYNFPFAQLTALVTIPAALADKEKRFPRSPIIVWIFVLLVWMAITTFFAFFPDSAFVEYKRTLKIQVMNLITGLVIVDRKKINALLGVIAASLAYYGVKGGIFTILTGGKLRVWGPEGSFIEGNNELALATLMVLPIVGYFLSITKAIHLKLGLFVVMALMAVSAMGSQSRGALVAALAMLIMYWWRSRSKVLTGTIGAILAVGIYFFMPESWHERMATVKTYQQDSSAMGRINAWTLAFNLACDRVTGGGFNHWSPLTFALYAPNPEDVHDAHSIYFEMLGEHGFIGLAIFLLIGWLSFRNAAWVMKKTKGIQELEWANMLARMLQATLVAYATGGAFLGLAYFDLYWNVVMVLIVLRKIVEDSLSITEKETSKIATSQVKPRSFVVKPIR
ncbi:putative O-glycosylation ligase, exosortase A system-associated [Methylocaldum szegediense]|uniref:Wzy family polymerase, exosortase system type 1 associated n=2 Tax=Methylocaldum szegediense TaxID=73780 RepID=A0ABN8XEH9_9GAMM|nr:putative O-glycosylation ligase, exosortase A system-associated [Methylocaldum szegediense]CAI8966732.1 Wzy family polymerase, exosortase system type 1 associated [Methylocaldum szegediense]